MEYEIRLPEKCEIIPPAGGWEEHTIYAVEVAFSGGNPIHKALFYTGFLSSKGIPSSYNGLWGSYDRIPSISEVYYMKVLEKLPESCQTFKRF